MGARKKMEWEATLRLIVMAGRVPAIRARTAGGQMAGTRPAMTIETMRFGRRPSDTARHDHSL
jgi:hypothetical protein